MRRSSGGRVTRLEAIHLTLAFLGEVDESRVPLLNGLPLKGERHFLPIDAARYHKRNEMVWAGSAVVPDALRDIVDSLRAFLAKEKFRTEEREFNAHVTLIRKARKPDTVPPLPDIDWPVEEVVLVRSRLSPQGSSYEVVQRFPLS